MSEPRWLSFTIVIAVHADQMDAHGGSTGLRDRGHLESALERPRNRLHYEPDSDLFSPVAAYGFGIARNHPVLDGNKRISFQAMYVFLGLNGLRIDAPEPDVVSLMMAVARGHLEEHERATWLRDNTVSR